MVRSFRYAYARLKVIGWFKVGETSLAISSILGDEIEERDLIMGRGNSSCGWQATRDISSMTLQLQSGRRSNGTDQHVVVK